VSNIGKGSGTEFQNKFGPKSIESILKAFKSVAGELGPFWRFELLFGVKLGKNTSFSPFAAMRYA
jgi:hypothetical protein